MTAGSMTYRKAMFPMWFFNLILGLMLILIGGVAVSHALDKHKEDAVVARNCIDNQGADMVYFKDDFRSVQLCFVGTDEAGSFERLAIRVLEKINGQWQELTAYTDSEYTTVNQAIGYMDADMGKYGWTSFVKECWKILFK